MLAVKVLHCKGMSEQLLYQMRKEIAILRKVSYDVNVVQYFGACLPNATLAGDDCAMLVMEYCEARERPLHTK